MTNQLSIKRWMKMPEISARGLLFHFVLSQNDDGIFITTCGKANRKDYEELTKEDDELIQRNPGLRCYFCFCSPRYYHAMKEKENDCESA